MGLLSEANISPSAAALAFCILTIGYVVWTLCYNVFFHPLASIPGPRLWAASRVPWCYCQWRGVLPHQLLELHKKYGHVVRVAPTEVSFTNEAGWKDIYDQRSDEMGKDPIFSLLTPSGVQNIMTADRETHTRQRRLLSHAFSEKALREQESVLQMYATKLVDQLSARSNDGPLDMVKWYNLATFDLIGDMAFGENFGCLDSGEEVPFVKSIKDMATELVFTQMAKYWNLTSIRGLFLSKEIAGQRRENMKLAMASVDRRINLETERKDFLRYILAANDDKGMSRAEIDVNAFSLNIAGSESTATLLCGITFLSLAHTDVYRRLVDEIRTAYQSEDEVTLASTSELEYVDAVMSESLRLYPPVAITMPRQVPSNGVKVDEYFLPAGTTAGVNNYSCFRHPDNFHRAEDFLPERWLPNVRDSAPFDKDQRVVMNPFSRGPRGCLGKNVAKAEVKLILAKMLFRFDLDLVAGQENWQSSQIIHGFWKKQPLYCRLTPAR